VEAVDWVFCPLTRRLICQFFTDFHIDVLRDFYRIAFGGVKDGEVGEVVFIRPFIYSTADAVFPYGWR